MNYIRMIVWFIGVVVFIGAYLYFTGGAGLPMPVRSQMTFLPQNPIVSAPAVSGSLASFQMPAMPENTNQQLDSLTVRTGEVSNTVGQVLGEAVKEASSSANSSLQERAFDYGRYLYCQQVVKDYEARTTTP